MSTTKLDEEHLTFLFHALDVGIVKVTDVIRWCDAIIEKEDQPDMKLVELSMAPKNTHEILKKLQAIGASESLTEDMCLTVAAAGYFSGKLSLEDARSYLFAKICIDNDGEMTELRQEIYIIDDECDWDPGRAAIRLQRLLDRYKSWSENLQSTLISDAKS